MFMYWSFRQLHGALWRIVKVGSIATLLTLFLCNNGLAIADTDTPTVFVRENIYTFIQSPQKLDALKKAIATMKSLPDTDTSSWVYQANIHGTYDTTDLPAWNTCQHGSYFFFPWHRMYLYYFERILRKASGDPTLALPYWNYSDNPDQRAIPEPFRILSTDSNPNPLYEGQRAVVYNQGGKLNSRDVSYTTALRAINFTGSSTNPGFGGVKVPSPTHFNSPHGLLERQPHDVIHVRIGGYMSNPNTAALDPIFWIHHANIDRLWEKWVQSNSGRSNPTDSDFLNQEFSFFDENGTEVKLTGSEILDTVGKLNYRYDDSPVQPIGSPTTRSLLSEKMASTPQPKPIEVGASPVTVSVPLPPAPSTRSRSLESVSPLPPSPYILNVQGIEYDPKNLVPYEIYVNLPPGVKPDPEGPYYAGTLALFAYPQNSTFNIDITDVVRKLKDSNPNVSITIIPPKPEQIRTSANSGKIQTRDVTVPSVPVIRFKQVTITH
jgi:hypothetical protein